jgi:glutamyl-tRNA synthetase
MPVIGRLAPSPTGHLHLGHARSFLIAWWSVRSQGGSIVLRIEDLDTQRSRPEFIDDCIRDLEWLGLDWDVGPRLQSNGLEQILAAAAQLERDGFTYPCVCTRGDLRASQSAPQEGVDELCYPGTCRGKYSSRERAARETGKAASLRFKVPPGRVTVCDGFSGDHEFDVSTDVGDFPVLRRDGAPAYQLAVVVDDARDGVTEVVRGDDLLASAARQQLLYEALKLKTPTWLHIPLVTDSGGRRLAKRADDISVWQLRQQGVDVRAIVRWVAGSIGCKYDGLLPAKEISSLFRWENIPQQRVCVSSETFSRA